MEQTQGELSQPMICRLLWELIFNLNRWEILKVLKIMLWLVLPYVCFFGEGLIYRRSEEIEGLYAALALLDCVIFEHFHKL